MPLESCIVENVLDSHALLSLKNYARNIPFKKVEKGNNTFLYLTQVPPNVTKVLQVAMEKAVGAKLKEVITFLRLNTSELDTEFRIHTDAKVLNQKPEVSAVFYLDTDSFSGTALFEHKIYGRYGKPEGEIFTEDDGNWNCYLKYFAVENSMFICNSDLYHGRFPWKSYGKDQSDGRIVIVKFMRYI